jgi:hypothetical protein
MIGWLQRHARSHRYFQICFWALFVLFVLFVLEQRREQLGRCVHRLCGANRDRCVQRLRNEARVPGQRMLRRLLLRPRHCEVRRHASGLLTAAWQYLSRKVT